MTASSDHNGRIFVSSTCYDLIDLRASLEATLKGVGLSPVLSDRPTSDFRNAGDANSIEACLVNLRRCERCVVVLSQRYGPTLKEFGFGDVSATHLEYNEAISRGIPVALYARDRLMADFGLWRKNKSFQPTWAKADDAPQLFEFLEKAMALGNSDKPNWVWPFTSSVDLCERVLKDLGSTASTAAIRMLTQQNRLPHFSMYPASFDGKTQRVTLKNSGTVNALRLAVRDPTGNVIYDDADFAPTRQEKFSFAFTSDMFSRCRGSPVIRVDYETLTGERLSDLFGLLPNAGGPLRIVPAGRIYVGGSLRITSPQLIEVEGIASISLDPINRAYYSHTL